jgi:hypothetical protein
MTTTFTILDGGMSRELMRVGAPFRQPEWSALALMLAPETVTMARRASPCACRRYLGRTLTVILNGMWNCP